MVEGVKGKKRPLDTEERSERKIIIKIAGPDGSVVSLRVRRNMSLQKILMQYCETRHFEYRAMDFTYDGARVRVRSTPHELNMVDDDQIDAFVRVGGGGGGGHGH